MTSRSFIAKALAGTVHLLLGSAIAYTLNLHGFNVVTVGTLSLILPVGVALLVRREVPWLHHRILASRNWVAWTLVAWCIATACALLVLAPSDAFAKVWTIGLTEPLVRDIAKHAVLGLAMGLILRLTAGTALGLAVHPSSAEIQGNLFAAGLAVAWAVTPGPAPVPISLSAYVGGVAVGVLVHYLIRSAHYRRRRRECWHNLQRRLREEEAARGTAGPSDFERRLLFLHLRGLPRVLRWNVNRPGSPKSARSRLITAISYLRAGWVADALNTVDAALHDGEEMDPAQRAKLYIVKALCFAKEGEGKRMEDALASARRLNPSCPAVAFLEALYQAVELPTPGRQAYTPESILDAHGVLEDLERAVGNVAANRNPEIDEEIVAAAIGINRTLMESALGLARVKAGDLMLSKTALWSALKGDSVAPLTNLGLAELYVAKAALPDATDERRKACIQMARVHLGIVNQVEGRWPTLIRARSTFLLDELDTMEKRRPEAPASAPSASATNEPKDE